MPSIRTLIERGSYDGEGGVELFRTDAINEYGLSDLPASVQTEIWTRAWDAGHASGYGEILNELDDLAKLVTGAIRAVIKDSPASWGTMMNALSLLLGRYESAVKDGQMKHLPAVTDSTLAALHRLHQAMSDLNYIANDD